MNGAGEPVRATPELTFTSSSAAGAQAPRRRLGTVLAVASIVVALDQATKAWAAHALVADPIEVLDGRLWLHTTRNSGAAFSLATSLTPLLSLIAVAAVITVLVLARRPTRLRHALVLGLFLGGAAGNLSDRLLRAPGPLRGHVVDWIDFRVLPSFNLADSALSTAAVLLVLSTLLDSRTRVPTGAPQDATSLAQPAERRLPPG